jgi:hypothetical protein
LSSAPARGPIRTPRYTPSSSIAVSSSPGPHSYAADSFAASRRGPLLGT